MDAEVEFEDEIGKYKVVLREQHVRHNPTRQARLYITSDMLYVLQKRGKTYRCSAPRDGKDMQLLLDCFLA